MDELIRELKSEGVLKSPYVEAAFRAIDRKDFVAPEYQDEAYGNYPLPIGGGQTISQPYTVAFMLDLLDPRPGEKILDVGAGSGWTTALLAHIVSQKGGMQNSKFKIQNSGRVLAVERIAELYRLGKNNVEKYNFIEKGVARFFCLDGTAGLTGQARFDKILASAAALTEIPQEWREQLKVGGVIVAPVGSSVRRYTKRTGGRWDEEDFPGFAFVPLIRERREYREDRENKESGRFRKHFIFFIIFIVSLTAYAIFVPLTPPPQSRRVEIPAGAGSRSIGSALADRGVVRSKWVFVTYAALSGQASSLKPGSYEFTGQSTLPAVVRKLVSGSTNEVTITIPEGWDLRDIGFYLENNGLAQAEELWKIAGFPAADYKNPDHRPRPADFSGEFAFLGDKPKAAGLEGYLYPDTYRVFRNAAIQDIVRKILENFDSKLTPELRREIQRQEKTIFEVITLASLVEKEVAKNEDRRMVAGILWKRLANGIPLQVDASVNYITAKRKTPSSGDLAIDSPFNTYRYPGLPLGPIANPGMEAIRAALYPEPSPYFYYLSTPDGRTIFSKTLEEHNTAKAKYLRWNSFISPLSAKSANRNDRFYLLTMAP